LWLLSCKSVTPTPSQSLWLEPRLVSPPARLHKIISVCCKLLSASVLLTKLQKDTIHHLSIGASWEQHLLDRAFWAFPSLFFFPVLSENCHLAMPS
jgi:hypothetical protein